jgi:hypothetical protein
VDRGTPGTEPTLTYQVSNKGRNALYWIGAWTVNTSLSRDFRIHENHRLNMRLDAFNANYITPSTTYTNPSIFGIIDAAATMRQLQVSLKYSF